MRTSKKISGASVRVLETLKILFENAASVQDIIRHFEKIDPNSRVYTSEVILKYINTLKVFGFRFSKKKDKYVLLNTPNQLDFNEEDLEAIRLIEKFVELFPEEKIKAEINIFLQDLEKHFSDNTRIIAHNIKKSDFINLGIDFKKYQQQIREYEQYCSDGQRLKITYKASNKSTTSVMVEPSEIKYIGRNIYLSVYNPLSAQIQDIKISSILKIEQLPLRSNPTTMYSSVTFQLKDRLAKAYRLRDSEKMIGVNSDGSIIISNQKEDRILLLKRLMRYGENCEVLSPKNLKENMKQLIQNTLNNY